MTSNSRPKITCCDFCMLVSISLPLGSVSGIWSGLERKPVNRFTTSRSEVAATRFCENMPAANFRRTFGVMLYLNDSRGSGELLPSEA